MNSPPPKKFLKKTNSRQFEVLVSLMEKNPDLARCIPTFGSSKVEADGAWNNIAQKVNSYGPPERDGNEWKMIWAHLKSRTKKKIGENKRHLHATGGGPFRMHSLTELEESIDRILHLSTAAAPSGKVFGVARPSKPLQESNNFQEIFSDFLESTPPRGHNRMAVVTPTTEKEPSPLRPQQRQSTILASTASQSHPSIEITPTSSQPKSTAPNTTISQRQPLTRSAQTIAKRLQTTSQQRLLGKRKYMEEKHDEQLKLLRQQVKIQENTSEAMKMQAEATKAIAEAAKVQTEAVKAVAENIKLQAEAITMIADSTEAIAIAMQSILKYLKRDNEI